MNNREKTLLYGALTAVALLLLFPFYWVLVSSVKSRDGMTMAPPSFYPAEVKKQPLSLKATAEGHDPGRVRLKGEDDQVIDGAKVIPGLGLRHIAVGPAAGSFGNLWPGHIKPGVSPLGANFRLADGRQILIQPILVGEATAAPIACHP